MTGLVIERVIRTDRTMPATRPAPSPTIMVNDAVESEVDAWLESAAVCVSAAWAVALAASSTAFDEAVRLAPKWAPFYISRGVTWDARGEHNRAIRDYTQAITLQPDAKSAYFARGLAYFGQGDFVLAAEDFAELKRDASDTHGVLWHHIARERAGSTDSREEFARVAAHQKNSRGFPGSGWIY